MNLTVTIGISLRTGYRVVSEVMVNVSPTTNPGMSES